MSQKKFISNLLLLTFSQAFLGILQAEAGLLGDYTPSIAPVEVEQRRTIGSGSRNRCKSNLPSKSITLLVPPSEVVHQTSSPTPSLYLFSKVASSLPFKFTLVNPQVAEPLVEQTFSVEQPGIKQIKLPETTKLEEGTVYLWYVAIPCQEKEQYQEVLRAAIERVPITTKVKTQLRTAKTDQETAAIYARNGIWYEAVDRAIKDSGDYLQQLLSTIKITS